MENRTKFMDFKVETDLKKKSGIYNIRIELENEVEDSNVRELAINLAGSVVRNNENKLYGERLTDDKLSLLIKERLNKWVPSETGFKANTVVAKKHTLSRN